jgi:TetR/AcrR family transcriptional regulator, regulator of cefoperazone and chloramphenicol sensitivity
MRSKPGNPRPVDDLTARARTRDAALVLFGEHGYRGTSIRDVARAAGVSPGLVQHHFGSKAGLREACDAHVLATLRATSEQKLEREEFDADFVAVLYETSQPVVRYIARGLTEGWPGASRWFDEAVAATASWLALTWPDRFPAGSERARQRAATMTAMGLGTIVLHTHLARWFGVDPLERGNHHLTGAAMIDVYASMGEFFASRAGRTVREALTEYARNVSSARRSERDE